MNLKNIKNIILEIKIKLSLISNWTGISKNEKLSENFIKKYKNKLDWDYISMYQKLSESFIREFKKYINWDNISINQKLSEDFIREFKDKIHWKYISTYQKLSENFIREFQDNVDWDWISKFQKLSESFIREFKDNVDWNWISKYQKLSESFIKEFNLSISDDNWLYKDGDYKLKIIKKCKLYIIENDYVIAYKGIRSDRYSNFNFQYQYLKGETYHCHADHNIIDQASFGLSAWTLKEATKYCNQLVVKVKIHKDDIAALVHNEHKIRCTKFTILD